MSDCILYLHACKESIKPAKLTVMGHTLSQKRMYRCRRDGDAQIRPNTDETTSRISWTPIPWESGELGESHSHTVSRKVSVTLWSCVEVQSNISAAVPHDFSLSGFVQSYSP